MSDEQKPPAEPKLVASNADSSPSSPKLSDAGEKSMPTFSSEAVSRPESKIRQFFRSFLRWTVMALIIFGLGVLAAYFFLYVPKSNDLKLAGQELATANAKISELQGEITTLENQINELSTLEERNQSLQADLDMAQLHVLLLDVLIDIRTAQYALADGDPTAAGEALENTTTTLMNVQQALEVEQTQIDALLSRLELAIGELETNSFAAQSDLEVLANSLLQLEETLFNET
jgi:TolA-binding protein